MSDAIKPEIDTIGTVDGVVVSEIASALLRMGNSHLGPIREMKIKKKDGTETGVALMVMIRDGRSYFAAVATRGLGEPKIALVNLEALAQSCVRVLYADDKGGCDA